MTHVTSSQAALRLSLSVYRIQKMVRNGDFPGFTVCNRTGAFLIPVALLPEIPRDMSEQDEKILNNFLYTDIIKE